MTTSLNSATPAREVGYEMVQYIAGRVLQTGADAPQVKIGTIPAGSILLGINSRISTTFAGGTPVINVGTTSGGTNLNGGVVPIAAGSGLTQFSATVAQPLAADTDVWVGTSGAATSGDGYFAVLFIKPLA